MKGLITIKRRKKIAICLSVLMLYQTLFPTFALALTSGPTLPEFTSFEPVHSTNMVDKFSGDFMYNLPVLNVPGPNGSGYSMSLSYHSGLNAENEASWVGYGWTLNPGAINRNKRGFPDDWNGSTVKIWNKTKPNRTLAGTVETNLEAFSNTLLQASANATIRYNNYKGIGFALGGGLSFRGYVTLGFNRSEGQSSFSLDINPAAALSDEKLTQGKAAKKIRKTFKTKYKNLSQNISKLKNNDIIKNTSSSLFNKLKGSSYGIQTFVESARATDATGYYGYSIDFIVELTGNSLPIPIGNSFEFKGSYSQQTNIPEMDEMAAYGYMYSQNAAANHALMDFSTEKESVYNKRDRNLGIPNNMADNFIITGEDIGGNFRMFKKKVGHYGNNQKENKTDIFSASVAIDLPTDLGIGYGMGSGFGKLTSGRWVSSTNFSSVSDDEGQFFRFANDLGGYVAYGEDKLQKAGLNTIGGRGSKLSYVNTANIQNSISPSEGWSGRVSRSSNITYNTNSALMNNVASGVHYQAYSKTQELLASEIIDRSKGNQIGEYNITNEDGNSYTYGLPVQAKKEVDLGVDIRSTDDYTIENNFVVYRSTEDNNLITKVGEERDGSYANAYLLTKITTPDYIDLTNNGPTDDDFGGYTSFEYDKLFGYGVDNNGDNVDDWYDWRIPYTGLYYSNNSLSSIYDDMGNYSKGQKEVYLLKRVETKTHYAVFYTSNRRDGLSAETNDDYASTDPESKGDKRLKKLDRIELFAKSTSSNPDKLIKTIHFEYDYSLCKGIPNYLGGNDPDNLLHDEGGKLTLKKVWFEYNGVVNARISPYKFSYAYTQSTDPELENYANYPDKYNALENYGASKIQNPNYQVESVDAWGNYRADGVDRTNNGNPWLNQTPPQNFDPAAWHLKSISLPSGGEIHVQYEQDEYCYVQDKLAHAMVSLKEEPTLYGTVQNNKYYLNVADIGIDDNVGSNSELYRLKNLINRLYVHADNPLYFKFLYKLIGLNQPELDNCNSEIISGYVRVREVDIDADGIYVRLGKIGEKYTLPKKVCEDFVKYNRLGKLSALGDNCREYEPDILEQLDVLVMSNRLLAATASLTGITACQKINTSKSYFKIPMTHQKLGGGVRVKRLLQYDKGITGDNPVLYGTEYLYNKYDENLDKYVSSGVATNEPAPIREENPLVGLLPRHKQGLLGKIITAMDKKEIEGPLGETLLPAPSVGYSQIITQSIHSGETSPGIQISEYFTAKDFPFGDGYQNPYKNRKSVIERQRDLLPLPLGLVNIFIDNIWASQGYVFRLNSMHGKVKLISTYGSSNADTSIPSGAALIAQQSFEYFEPDEEVPVLNSQDLSVQKTLPLGKEMDLTMATRKVEDKTHYMNLEADATAGITLLGLIPYYSVGGFYTYQESSIYTHVTNKVIRYPTVLKSVTTLVDGVYSKTENTAFDPNTGRPVMTQTTDGFDNLDLLASNNHSGVYKSYNITGSSQYKSLGPKGISEGRKITSTPDMEINKLVINNKAILEFVPSPGVSVCDAMNVFTSGDLVSFPDGKVFHIGEFIGNAIELLPTSYSTLGSNLMATEVTINRSGRTNQLSVDVGHVTTYGNSSVSLLPLPSDQLDARIEFVNLLNAAAQTGDTIRPQQIPNNLEFKLSNGSCGTWPEDQFIKIENGSIDIYSTDPTYLDEVVVGTPSNPHPMVDALNNYFDTYYNYDLGTLNPGDIQSSCTYQNIQKQDLANTVSEVNQMQSLQTTDLIQPFADVNNNTHSIADFFMDLSMMAGYTQSILDNNSGQHLNKQVMLLDNLNQSQYGLMLACPNYENQPIQVKGGCKKLSLVEYHPAVEPGHFYQTIDGRLGYQAEIGQGCEILNIRFFRMEDTGPTKICSQPLSEDIIDGMFDLDPETANLGYYEAGNDCYPQKLTCFSFCESLNPSVKISNVVSCGAQTLDDNWKHDEFYASSGLNLNEYESGKKGKWRVSKNFIYQSETEGKSNGFEKNYEAGTYELSLFNWSNPSASSENWLNTTTITKYSPNGNALQEENILGIQSVAKFGYHDALPYLIGSNCNYETTQFESFENVYSVSGKSYFENGVQYFGNKNIIDESVSHSGSNSLEILAASNGFLLGKCHLTDQEMNQGVLMQTWFKTDALDRTIVNGKLRADIQQTTGTANISIPFSKKLQVGEWYLMEAKFSPAQLQNIFNSEDEIVFGMHYNFVGGTERIWVDDIKIQPIDAEVVTYVYDPVTLRILAALDNQHLGTYYQYNTEGRLVRKSLETERGKKILEENHLHIKTESRIP